MKKQLKTIKNQDTKIGGLALGIGEYFEIDPTIIRILMFGLIFTPVPIILIYSILWIVLPSFNENNSKKYGYQIA